MLLDLFNSSNFLKVIVFFYGKLGLFVAYLYYLYKTTNFKSKLTGGDIVANVLYRFGIKQLFTLTGGHISPILVSSEKLGIKVVDVRNEANAVFAADAVSRLSPDGQIGIAVVTAGPGVTNCITACRNAQMAESGLVLIGGASPLLLKGRGSLQDVEQLKLLKGVCKAVYGCNRIQNLEHTMEMAILEAKNGVPGPVFVEVPIDLLYPIQQLVDISGVNKPTKSFFQKIVNKYIFLKICYFFSNNNITLSNKKYPLLSYSKWNDKIKTKKINKIIGIIKSSKKPVIVISSQILNVPNRNRQTQIEEMAEWLKSFNIPIYCSGGCRGLLGKDKWKYEFRHKRKMALRNADCILLLGVSCDFRMDYGRCLNKKAKIISINENSDSLKLNHGVFWKSTLSIHISPFQFIKQLYYSSELIKFPDITEWIEELQSRENAREEQIASFSNIQTNKNSINPIQVCKYVNSLIDDKTIVILDGGDFAGTAAYTIRPKGALKWLDPGPFGTLGVGGGFAIGAKMCFPDYRVIIIWGDGASGYSIIEYDTIERFGLTKVIGVIGNDACWSQIRRDQVKILNSDVATNLKYSDYQKMGECFGIDGNRFTNGLELKKSIDMIKQSEKSYIYNIVIDKSEFREGSISV